VAVILDAVRGGVRFVLLRERDLDALAFRRLAERLAHALPRDTVLSVHTRVEVARALGAGLHLAEAEPSAPPGSLWHGRSVHGVAAVERARCEGAAYLVAGTLFSTVGKEGQSPSGPQALRSMCAAAGPLPVYAIGGIDAGRVAVARGAGAHGVAVVGAILEADAPEAAAGALLRALD
jgi:thiamine-phosphate pyrophosphorylase